MSKEDEFELNYVKIDGKNEIKLLGGDDYAAEVSTFFSTVTEFEQEKVPKRVIKEIQKNIPEKTDIFKSNIEFAKKFLKIIKEDKKNSVNTSVNRILSVDFKNQFIFNYENLYDVCCIVSLFFNKVKSSYKKITSIDDLRKKIKATNLQRIDFFKLFTNNNSLKSIKVNKSFSLTNKSKSTENSSIKDMKDNDSIFENEEISYNDKMYELMIEKNIKCNSVINSVDGYFKEETPKKVLTKNNFIYPNSSEYGKDLKLAKDDLPIELLMLLAKLREVNCLIFQIQNVENNFKKLAIFVLSNINWLFIKGISEVKFDLENEKIQKELYKSFESRTEDLYLKNDINKNKIHYDGYYKARSINCWEPEGDIFIKPQKIKNTSSEFVYNTQMSKECIIYDDNCIGNIYNEFGNLSNIKYIIPVNYFYKNKDNNELILSQQTEQRSTLKYLDDDEFNSTIEKLNDQISIFDIENTDLFGQRNSLNSNNANNNLTNTDSNNDFNNKNSTPFMLRDFTNQYKSYFKMILTYSDFFTGNLINIKKLSLFFHTSFSYEMYLCFKTNLNLELTHFLIFLNKIDSLREINCSFNSLDDKSFEYILGILFKNTHLHILRLSFFSPDINYYDNALFNLCSAKRISLTKLFSEFDEYLKKHDEYSEMKINDFILEEKLLNSLAINFINLSTLLKLQLLKNLSELVLRFDIPIPIQNNPSYIILIIKFLMNIIIMLTFQQNNTHTFKILAPNLELNCNQYPYIRAFFQEITLTDEVDKYQEIKEIEKEKMKQKKEKEKQEQLENQLKQKNEKGEIINKLGDSDIITQIPQEKNEIDIDKSLENYDSSKRYKSMIEKSINEKAANRRRSTESIKPENKSRKLNPNESLEYLVIQMRILYLPEIFNICKINNLSGLKSINLGYLDEISFKGFVTDYKLYAYKLKSLISIKINLGISVLSYKNLEDYILDYIYVNSPMLEEKFLLSNLIIQNENMMKELIEIIYLKADIQKIVFSINNKNIDLLSKLLSRFIIQYKARNINTINSLVLLMQHPKLKALNKLGLSKYLSDFITLSKDRKILCNENPEMFQ